jgi:succinate dehydrogenase / fumarate reductase membrane anchor subunit
MSGSKSSIRTPLGRVRGLGSAGAGTSDFWRQRLTAIAMILLIVPSIIIVLKLGPNHAAATQILGSTFVAIVLLLFTIASVWHMKIGMQVVIEDYVHDERLKLILIIGNNFFSAAVALASIYAICKLSFGGV